MDKVIAKIREFNRFYTNIIGVLNNHILESDYSLTAVRILYEIYHHKDITARQIKEMLKVDEGYLSREINKLAKQKMITRKKSKEDNRVYSLQLTQTGETRFLKLDQRSHESIQEMIRHLGKKEQEQLAQQMDEIQRLLNGNNGSV